MILIIKIDFLNYYFLNIFNNFFKIFYRDIIIIKVFILINFINYINKLYKTFNK